LIHLRWSQVDLDTHRLRVNRLKAGEDSVHPLSGREIRGLRKLRRSQPVGSRYVFVTGRGTPMTHNGFDKLLEKAAAKAGIDAHPHLLRHGTGYRLVNWGMDTLSLAAYLGHRQIQNTTRYTKMNATRFDGLWKDWEFDPKVYGIPAVAWFCRYGLTLMVNSDVEGGAAPDFTGGRATAIRAT
jgi:integrase